MPVALGVVVECEAHAVGPGEEQGGRPAVHLFAQQSLQVLFRRRIAEKGLDLETALTRLKGLVGTRYDARVVAAFIAACEVGKIRPGVTRLTRNQKSDYLGPAIPALPVAPTSDSSRAVN